MPIQIENGPHAGTWIASEPLRQYIELIVERRFPVDEPLSFASRFEKVVYRFERFRRADGKLAMRYVLAD
jgi:hypothetical protein